MAKEPKSAKEVLSNLSKGKGTDPVMGLRFKGSKKHLINKKTKVAVPTYVVLSNFKGNK